MHINNDSSLRLNSALLVFAVLLPETLPIGLALFSKAVNCRSNFIFLFFNMKIIVKGYFLSFPQTLTLIP